MYITRTLETRGVLSDAIGLYHGCIAPCYERVSMPKDSITIRLQSDLIDSLEAEADEQSVSRSEYIRQILRQRHEVDELQEKVDTLQ